MSIRVSNIRLGLDEPEAALIKRLANILRVPESDIGPWRILRKSLDARDKDHISFVYSLAVSLPDEEARIAQMATRGAGQEPRVELYAEPTFSMPEPGNRPMNHRPIVVGSGPGGLAAAYFLAERGYRPLVLERGRPVRDRIRDVRDFDAGGPLNPESNYLFGEGGAGTFSDGKLTCRSSGPDVERVLQLFAACKGKPSILYEYRPHLGSNRLPAVVKALRRAIEARGGEFRFSCRVEDLDLGERGGLTHAHALARKAQGHGHGQGQGEATPLAPCLRGVSTSSGYTPADVIVLAIGHSARDTYEMLRRRGVPMTPKPFQMGIRIEQPQETVNRVQYGPNKLETRLGAADYTLIARSASKGGGQHDLFTFCMCAGGNVIPSVAGPGFFCTNGMSLSHRDTPFANSGLMITVRPEDFGGDDLFAGIRLQETYERKAFEIGRGEYRCPIQPAEDFLARRTSKGQPPASSYSRSLLSVADMAELVPPVIRESLYHGLPILDHRWQGRFLKDATLVGPEARGSSPVRITRDETSRENPGVIGLYPVGEGAGYAGGIVSAAVDGLRTAKAIVARYALPSR
jgi:uncharacterized FAD-dependent dehydrogenase